MNKTKEFILRLLSEDDKRYLEVMNHSHFAQNPLIPKRAIESLHRAHLIKSSSPGGINAADNPLLFLTTAGWDLLDELDEAHEQQAKNERQQRFQNKISVASVLVPFITFLLGLAVEHWTGLAGLLLSLFSS